MNLEINDVGLSLQLIDVAAARGAFKPEEFSTVGQLRDRLTVFLKAAKEASEKQQQEEGKVTTAPNEGENPAPEEGGE